MASGRSSNISGTGLRLDATLLLGHRRFNGIMSDERQGLALLTDKLAALAAPVRMQLCLHMRDRGPVCVRELADLTGVPPSRLTRHLHRLQRAGLVTKQEQNSRGTYQLVLGGVPDLTRLLGAPVGAATNAPGWSDPDQERLRFLSRIAEQSGEGVGVANMDGVITYINPAGAAMLGYEPAEVLGQHASVLHAADVYASQVEPLRAQVRLVGRASAVLEYRRRDGSTLIGDSTLTLLTDDTGTPVGLVRSVRDITDRLTAEREQRASQERLNAIVLTLRDLICVLNSDGLIQYASPSWEEAMGLLPAGLVGTNVFSLVHPDDRDRVVGRARQRLDESAGTPVSPLEMRLQNSRGDYLWYEAVANPLPLTADGSVGLAVSLRVVQDRKRLEQRLLEQSTTDTLTGLANRGHLMAKLGQALTQSCTSGAITAVVYIDLNGFKPVNDNYGHATGDQLLVHVADRLRGGVRKTDTVARIGGDEFVLLLPELAEQADAQRAARMAAAALRRPFQVTTGVLQISASVGVAIAHPGQTADGLLQQADQAMYRHKYGSHVQTSIP